MIVPSILGSYLLLAYKQSDQLVNGQNRHGTNRMQLLIFTPAMLIIIRWWVVMMSSLSQMGEQCSSDLHRRRSEFDAEIKSETAGKTLIK